MGDSILFSRSLGLKGLNFERLIGQYVNDSVVIVKGQWMSRWSRDSDGCLLRTKESSL